MDLLSFDKKTKYDDDYDGPTSRRIARKTTAGRATTSRRQARAVDDFSRVRRRLVTAGDLPTDNDLTHDCTGWANTHRRRDATDELSRVGGVHGIRKWLAATVSTSLNKFANSESSNSSCVVSAA